MASFKITQDAVERLVRGDIDFIRKEKRPRKGELTVLANSIFIDGSGLTFCMNGKDILKIDFPFCPDLCRGETISIELKEAQAKMRLL